MRLHITNGDSAGGELKRLFPADAVLSWRDPLHDGPVPAGLPLHELSEVRAAHIAAVGWAPLEQVRAEFQDRDATLEIYAEFDETILWFEHDLYDQLQLIQLLDWFAGRAANLSLAQSSDYLGCMKPEALLELFHARAAVTPAQYELARIAWRAFRSNDPRGLLPLLDPRPELPFLGPALERWCEEYPSVADGLSRTERVIAELKAEGLADPCELFARYARTENPIWMGDSSFFLRLEGRLPRESKWLWDPTRRRFAPRP